MVDLFPHQIDAIGRMHNGSVLKGGVGTGKSRTAIAYYYTEVCKGPLKINGLGSSGEMAEPRDLYIVTTARKRDSMDWIQEAAPFAISSDPASSISGVKLTVLSWNEIGKLVGVRGAFIVFDEQRLVGSGAWVKSFLSITKQNQWILLSATPGDTWLDYIPVFIANGFYKNRTEFVRTHVVYKNHVKWPVVDHFVDVRRLEQYRNDIVIHMPMARHTVRHVQNIIVDYPKLKFEKVVKKRWHVYEERPLKDVGEMFTVMRKVVNTDVSRLGAVMELNEIHPRLILFYNFDYELEIIRQLPGILEIDYAEWNGHKHQEVPTSDRWIYAVQYTAGSEAWNCITTDAMVFWSLTYSYKVFEQSQGRIDRLNTPYTNLNYYVLRSSSMIDNAIVRSLRGKREFNERAFEREMRVHSFAERCTCGHLVTSHDRGACTICSCLVVTEEVEELGELMAA